MESFSNYLTDYLPYLVLFLFVLVAVLTAVTYLLRKNIKNVFRGGNMDIENVLLDIRNKQDGFSRDLESASKRVGSLEEAVPKNIRKVGLVRYNPFSDAGGDQSFALALLNDRLDGIVISSLYGRDINRVYTKSIKNGKSQYQLTEEEIQAIKGAV